MVGKSSKFYKNYKLVDLKSLMNPKHKKHEENYTKHIIIKLLKTNANEKI